MPRKLMLMGETYVRFSAEVSGCGLSRVPRFSRSIGGAAAWAATAAARLGMHPRLITSVGTDAFGTFLCDALAATGVQTQTVFHTDAGATPKRFCAFPSEAAPESCYDRIGTADVYLPEAWIQADWFADVGALYFCSGGLRSESACAAQMSAIRYASAKNAVICYDYAMPPDIGDDALHAASIDRFLSQAHIIACSADTMPHLIGEANPMDALPHRMHGRRKLWLLFEPDGSVQLLTKHQQHRVLVGAALLRETVREAFLAAFLHCALQEDADPRMLPSLPYPKLLRWLTIAAAYASLCGTRGTFATQGQLRMLLHTQCMQRCPNRKKW